MSSDLDRKYQRSIEYLDENFAFFLTHVLNMGDPDWRNDIPTAAVALPKDEIDFRNFKYVFNPTFANSLSDEHLAFVMAHETMHILLNHLRLHKTFDRKDVFNIAADCVINDYLTSMGLDGPDFMTGEKNVGYDCSNSTVGEVYRALMKNPPQPEGQQGEGQDGADSDGQPGHGPMQGNGQAIDDHSWMEPENQGGSVDEREQQEKAADKIYEDTKNKEGVPSPVEDTREDDSQQSKYGSPGGGPGSSGPGALKNWAKQKGVGLKWAELLKRINPDVFKSRRGPRPRTSWRANRRKLGGMVGRYPDVRLPIYEKPSNQKGGEVPAIVMALDTSGSCISYADTFITLAKSIPQDRIKLFCCTFTTRYQELDLENPVYSSGGTHFDCIEAYIEEKVVPQLGHYPKSVVVITDGEATFSQKMPKKDNQNRWLWLLTAGGRYVWGELPGDRENLEKYATGV